MKVEMYSQRKLDDAKKQDANHANDTYFARFSSASVIPDLLTCRIIEIIDLSTCTLTYSRHYCQY